jgi:hypothetical protein
LFNINLERKIKKAKAKTCLFVVVSTTIFIRIMSIKSANDVWDYLKEEYVGDERIHDMQMLVKVPSQPNSLSC